MNRFEFMRQLEELLADISPMEKEEALTYYNDYFNDAGEENEQQVIADLQSPDQVARVVREGLGFQKQPEKEVQNEADEKQVSGNEASTQKPLSPWAIAAIVIGVIFCSPIILAAVITVLSILFAIVITWFSILIAFGAMALSFFAVTIVFWIVGAMLFPVGGWLALALIGCGALMAALGILFMIVTVLMAGQWTPALFRGIGWLFGKVFRK